jgi:hypothetical protein
MAQWVFSEQYRKYHPGRRRDFVYQFCSHEDRDSRDTDQSGKPFSAEGEASVHFTGLPGFEYESRSKHSPSLSLSLSLSTHTHTQW